MSTWLRCCANSVDKILTLQAQGLHPIDIGNGNGSIAIGNDGVGMHISTFIVHLEHLRLIRIIVDRHLLITYHSDTADLTRMEPAHVNMGSHPIRKAQIEMSNVMNMCLQMSMCLHIDVLWYLTKQIEQDGYIMWSQVPDDVDVVAK